MASPEADARVVPRGGEHRVLALGAVDGEEVERLVVGVVQSHGHDNVPQLHVGPVGETLVEPELLDFHLSAFLYLVLVFAALVVFHFDGRTRARVLKLYFGAHGPPLSEVVAQIDHGVGDVKPSVALVVFVSRSVLVAVVAVAVEHAAVGHFTISAHTQAIAFDVVRHRVGCVHLGVCRGHTSYGKHTGQEAVFKSIHS